MAARCISEEVRAVIPNIATIDMDPFIGPANRLTNRVASNDTAGLLSAGDLKDIEIYLAAWLYAFRDQQLQSKSTGKSSGQFMGQTGKRLDANYWGQTAMVLDGTGYLSQLNAEQLPAAGMTWLGKTQSEQLDWEERN